MSIAMRSLLLAFLALAAWLPVDARAQTEYELKAGYLRHFAEFTIWPEDSEIADPSQPFSLCVFGEHPIGSVLEEEDWTSVSVREGDTTSLVLQPGFAYTNMQRTNIRLSGFALLPALLIGRIDAV